MAKVENNLVPGQKSHSIILEEVVNRLTEKNKYDLILKNVVYSCKGLYNINYHGEIDILARRKDDKSWLFIEIKSNPFGDYYKAKKQYKRFSLAYPCMNNEGILVYPDIKDGLDYLHCQRLYPSSVNR